MTVDFKDVDSKGKLEEGENICRDWSRSCENEVEVSTEFLFDLLKNSAVIQAVIVGSLIFKIISF